MTRCNKISSPLIFVNNVGFGQKFKILISRVRTHDKFLQNIDEPFLFGIQFMVHIFFFKTRHLLFKCKLTSFFIDVL